MKLLHLIEPDPVPLTATAGLNTVCRCGDSRRWLLAGVVLGGSGGSCLRSVASVCVCLVFSISLHAARRAMTAACRCPCGRRPFLHPRYMTMSCPQPLWVILGLPHLLLPKPPDRKKGIRKDKGKRQKKKETLGRARPVLLSLLS